MRHVGGIWGDLEASGGIWRHLVGSGGIWRHLERVWWHLGGIWEASGRHLGDIWVASGEHLGGIWGRSMGQESLRRHLGGIWRHLEKVWRHLGGIWEAYSRFTCVFDVFGLRHLLAAPTFEGRLQQNANVTANQPFYMFFTCIWPPAYATGTTHHTFGDHLGRCLF